MLGELFGTMVLVLLGDGVVAGVLLAKSKAQNAGWIVITAGWGIAVVCGIFTSKALGGPGSLNPVGPVAEMLMGQTPPQKALELVASQFAGAFAGAVLVWLHYLPHWSVTDDKATKLGVFCTAPAIRAPGPNFLSEVIGTFVLIFVAELLGKSGGSGFSVGLLVWGIGLSLGGTTGYAINPARDLGPRIAHALLPIAGKGSSDWSYSWVPVLGPLLGGIVAVLLLKAVLPA